MSGGAGSGAVTGRIRGEAALVGLNARLQPDELLLVEALSALQALVGELDSRRTLGILGRVLDALPEGEPSRAAIRGHVTGLTFALGRARAALAAIKRAGRRRGASGHQSHRPAEFGTIDSEGGPG